MKKVAVVTDTNSGMTPEEAKKLGVFLLAMPFNVNGQEYIEGVNCSYEHFFEMLEAGDNVSTSQPSPMELTSLWDSVLKEYDELVHIPMSSSLSGSCETAMGLARNYDGKVVVVDNKRISISQRESVLDALVMAKAGIDAKEIGEKLEANGLNASIYLAVNTLELLKKSGRVTAAGAALATVLGLKPVLQIQGQKLDAFAKVRGMKKAEKTMIDAAKKDMDTRFKGKEYVVQAAYTGELSEALVWKATLEKAFGMDNVELYQLPISISCHVGAGVKAVGVIGKPEKS